MTGHPASEVTKAITNYGFNMFGLQLSGKMNCPAASGGVLDPSYAIKMRVIYKREYYVMQYSEMENFITRY
jgi:hypothetical protein